MSKEINNSEHSRAKVNRGVAALTALSLLATGCVATEGGQVQAKIIDEPTKTSPLSPDLTKTPAPSPTEANYELTPTVKNPATEELTLAPEPTATATEMPTPTEIPEKYPIDLEKLHNFPESYEYVIAHPDEFVEAPNPFKDIDAFNDWFYNKFVPTLGEWTEREVNYATSTIGAQPDFYVADAYGDPKEMLGEPEFFYFNNYGTLYPVITLNVFSDNQKSFLRTISAILYDGVGATEGTTVLKSLSTGEKIRTVTLFRTTYDLFPADVNRLIEMGINAYRDELDYNQVVIGIGRMRTTGYKDY